MGYEYRTEVMTHGFMGIHKGEIKRSMLVEILNDMGRDGWDLVHVWFDQKLQGEKDGHLLIFRREDGARIPEPRGARLGVHARSARQPLRQLRRGRDARLAQDALAEKSVILPPSGFALVPVLDLDPVRRLGFRERD